MLALVLDVLVPASDGFPGAATVAIDHVLAVAAASADVDTLLSDGLQAVEEATRALGAAGLASLGVDDREDVLRRVEQSHAEFFEALVRHTYDGYYSHPTVIARLGLDASPCIPAATVSRPSTCPISLASAPAVRSIAGGLGKLGPRRGGR